MKDVIGADVGMTSGGWLDRMVGSQRRQLFDAFQAWSGGDGSILSVGIKPGALFDKPDYLVEWADPAQRARTTSYAVEGPRAGRGAMAPEPAKDVSLPFRDAEFDWVFCNEVIEHAGHFERQLSLLKELYRVARKGVFLTTPNRRHPLEFHTGLPLIHLLPDPAWRRLLRLCGKGAWASDIMLNPLDSAALYRMADLLPGKPMHDVGHKRIWGIKAHFFLMLEKAPRPTQA